MIATQHNAWVHGGASIVVVIAGVAFHLAAGEWCWIVAAMMSVWTAEAINTSFEFLCDVASPEFHPTVEKAKDVAAGAVLLSAIGSVIVGLLVFLPHLRSVIR